MGEIGSRLERHVQDQLNCAIFTLTPSITRGISTLRTPYSYRTDPTIPSFPDDRPIIVFDGYCALCSGWASFVLKHDRNKRFRLFLA